MSKKKQLDPESPELNEDYVDELMDHFAPVDIAIGIPDGERYDYTEEFEEWYTSLHRSPATNHLDFRVMTEAELRERWNVNYESLVRILKNYDIRMEHRRVKNVTGTYRALSRQFVGQSFADHFVFSFFDLSEDALFRASDILEFEKTHPEVIHPRQPQSLNSQTPTFPPPDDSPPLDFSDYPQRAPEGQDLIDAIEQYLHDHPVNLNNKEKVLNWVRLLTKDFESKYPNFTKKRLWNALEDWRKVGAFVTSKSQFYKIVAEDE